MTLKQWADNGWLKPHKTSSQEIKKLLCIVERDLVDAGKGISPDWRFNIAYNAALQLCTVLLYASGYRAAHGSHHFRTIEALPLILGPEKKGDADYLNACRMKRNILEYDVAGVSTDENADELVVFASGLRNEVLAWLKKNHPDYF